MGQQTEISWCDSTINPTTGCDGCELWTPSARICYAGTLHEGRLAKSLPALYAPNFKEVRLAPGRMLKAAAWSDLRGQERPNKPHLSGLPRLIFVGDMGDFLSRDVSEAYFIEEILAAIQSPAGQRHIWLLLTKRPRRLAAIARRSGGLPRNVMAMTTITDQATARKRVAALMEVDCRWKGISAEPLRGRVNMYNAAGRTWSGGIDWLIAGGASGAGAQAMPNEWALNLRSWCQDSLTAFFFKQRGGSGRDKGGCLLDGHEYKGVPAFNHAGTSGH